MIKFGRNKNEMQQPEHVDGTETNSPKRELKGKIITAAAAALLLVISVIIVNNIGSNKNTVSEENPANNAANIGMVDVSPGGVTDAVTKNTQEETTEPQEISKPTVSVADSPPEPDLSNLVHMMDEMDLDISGLIDREWGHIGIKTLKNEGGTFDPAWIYPDCVVSVYYSSDFIPEVIAQSWTDGNVWGKVAPFAVNNSNNIAQFSYAQIVGALGTDDISGKLDKFNVGSRDATLEVVRVTIGKAKGELPPAAFENPSRAEPRPAETSANDDFSNLTAVTDEIDLGVSGSSDGTWSQGSIWEAAAITIDTIKIGNGTLDPAWLYPDCILTVYYSSSIAPYVIMQSWTDGAPVLRGNVAASAVNNSNNIAQYTYEDLIAAFGTDDLNTYLDRLIVGGDVPLKVSKVTIGKAVYPFAETANEVAELEAAFKAAMEQAGNTDGRFDNAFKSIVEKTEYADGSILMLDYDDFDGDGKPEVFLHIGEGDIVEEDRRTLGMFGFIDEFENSGELWFIDSLGINDIKVEEDYRFYWSFVETFKMDGFKYLVLESHYPVGSTSYIYGVKDGKPYELPFSGLFMNIRIIDRDTIYITHSVYDAQFDEMDDRLIGLGHTYKTYFFFWDNGFKEYGGMYITEDEFLKFDGAAEIIATIRDSGMELYDIIYRANGIININFGVEKDGLYFFYNVTLEYDETSVQASYQDEGIYLPALTGGLEGVSGSLYRFQSVSLDYPPALVEGLGGVAVYPERFIPPKQN